MRQLLFLLLCATTLHARRPKITIVCIVDQLAEHVLGRHRPFLTGGIAHLLKHGKEYRNAYYPHALPATSTGHAALSTGTSAQYHGIVANEWYDDGVRKACDDPGTHGPQKKSARNLMAPTLATSCINDDVPLTSISLSLKSRAAIPTAGPYGTAVWFDSSSGQFTSSQAFGSRTPAWVTAINKHLQNTLHHQKMTNWQSVYPSKSKAYQFVIDESYQHTGYHFPLVDTPQPMDRGRKPYFLYQQTPASNHILTHLAHLALRLQKRKHPDRDIILWLSMSSLDYIGHYYGPYSKEAIDLIYHIDKQLGDFVKNIEHEFGAQNCLWALTSDHGCMPIPEHLQKQGRMDAQRIDSIALQKDLNRALYKAFNVKNYVIAWIGPHMYIDHAKHCTLTAENRIEIVTYIKQYLTAITGIKHAWHRSDFEQRNFQAEYGVRSRELWFAKQYYPGRSGDFVVMVAPHTYLTTFEHGTSHDSPYDYDTRVPLVLYGPGRITPGIEMLKTSMFQLPTTLAHLLEVQRPALAPLLGLPGIE